MDVEEVIDKMLKTSRNDMAYAVEGLQPEQLAMVSSVLMFRAALYAELAAYADYRGGCGCGDHGHEEALQRAHGHMRLVRRTLGFSIP